MNRKIIAIGVAAVVLVAAGAGVAYAKLGSSTTVGTATASVGALKVTISAPGTVSAADSRGVYARATGTIATVLVADGDRVKAGQPLIELATAPLKLAVAQARAALATARAAQHTAAASAPTATETSAAGKAVNAAQSALSTARKNYRAYKHSDSRDASTVRTLRTAVTQAEANLALARSNRDRLAVNGQTGLAENAAGLSVKAAQLALAAAEKNLAGAQLTAPVAGTVEVPDTVEVGAGVTPGVAVVQVSGSAATVFEASVDQADVSGVKAGDAATVSLDAFADAEVTGTVLSRAETATPTATGGVAFTTRISLGETSIEPLAGMGGSAEITVDEIADALTVPAAALLADGDNHYVFVVAHGRAEHRVVQIGAQTDTAVQVTSGLTAGEVVATTGASALTDGQSVRAS